MRTQPKERLGTRDRFVPPSSDICRIGLFSEDPLHLVRDSEPLHAHTALAEDPRLVFQPAELSQDRLMVLQGAGDLFGRPAASGELDRCLDLFEPVQLPERDTRDADDAEQPGLQCDSAEALRERRCAPCKSDRTSMVGP